MVIETILKINNPWTELFNFQTYFNCHWLELWRTAPLPIHKVIIITIFLGGIYVWGLLVYFVNKHPNRTLREITTDSHTRIVERVFFLNLSLLQLNPFPNDKFWLPYWKSLQTTISKWIKMAESSQDHWKTVWKKEKLLITSNFSFSHSVFTRLVLQTRNSQGLFTKGIIYTFFIRRQTFSASLHKRLESMKKRLSSEPDLHRFQKLFDLSNFKWINRSAPTHRLIFPLYSQQKEVHAMPGRKWQNMGWWHGPLLDNQDI